MTVASIRRRTLLSLALVSLALVCFGCGPGSGFEAGTLVDSVGERVTFDGSSVLPAEGSRPPIECDGEVATEAGWRLGGSRVVALCPATGTRRAIDCRPLVCGDDSDCPTTSFFDVACRAGVCERLGEPLRDEDVVLTCVAELPRLERCEDSLTYSTDALTLVGDAIERHCGGGDTCDGPVVCGLEP